MKNNKERLQRKGIWEDDATRELKMEQEEAFQKQMEAKVKQMLKDGNVELFTFLKEPSTVTFAIQDSTNARTRKFRASASSNTGN